MQKVRERGKPFVCQRVLTLKVCSFIQWGTSGWDGRHEEYFRRNVNLDKVLLGIFSRELGLLSFAHELSWTLHRYIATLEMEMSTM